jgi:acetyl-CoA C-acetyltransferase
MSLDSRTPVLVGVAAVSQRERDPAAGREPLELMVRALECAAEDAGAPALLGRADGIRVPRGFWNYSDPGRLIAERFGAPQARTQLAELGVLQTTILGRAARDIATGRADVVLVTGGEARYRTQRGERSGIDLPCTLQQGVQPDSVLRPSGAILSDLELASGFGMPVAQYAMIENALRAAEGVPPDTHRRNVATLWEAFSQVAAANPDSWMSESVAADDIREPRHGNRMIAYPYTRWHSAQWNVDQAAGVILCSAGTASELGIDRARWVFPLAVAESNHMLPLPQRRHLHRSLGFAWAGRRVAEHIGRDLDSVEHLELYSCFPSAVRVQMRELGIGGGHSLTVTGGMAFAGGPLNNFVLQGLVRMAQVLRGDRGATGIVTAVSGMLTKQGVSAWSTETDGRGFGYEDVSREAARDTEVVEVVGEARGHARVVGYTVEYRGGDPVRALILCDLDDGRRVLISREDRKLAESLIREEPNGRRLVLDGSPTLE